jgi:hypothetical protein
MELEPAVSLAKEMGLKSADIEARAREYVAAQSV